MQECAAFLTARGGKQRTKAKHTKTKSKITKTKSASTVTMGVDIEQEDSDVLAVLGDQRALDGNWGPEYCNKAVLVGTRIKHDSKASIKAKRPRYWTATQGVPNLLLFEHGSVDVASYRHTRLCILTLMKNNVRIQRSRSWTLKSRYSTHPVPSSTQRSSRTQCKRPSTRPPFP